MITKFKIYETFDENKVKIGDILKRKTIDEKHYELSIITYIRDNSRLIQICNFAITSLDFKYIKFIISQSSPYDINRWYINEYSLINENELYLLCEDICKVDDYYFEKIYKLTHINLKEYALNKISEKYNL